MSALHLRQIETKLQTLLYPLIDMSDQKIGSETFEDVQRSRALAGYIVHHLTACPATEAANSIVDGGDDNGLDAIYFHEPEETLYIVQSKWIKDGKGEPDNGAVKKFCSGVNDLLSQSYDRFNKKIQAKSADINEALGIPSLKISVVL